MGTEDGATKRAIRCLDLKLVLKWLPTRLGRHVNVYPFAFLPRRERRNDVGESSKSKKERGAAAQVRRAHDKAEALPNLTSAANPGKLRSQKARDLAKKTATTFGKSKLNQRVDVEDRVAIAAKENERPRNTRREAEPTDERSVKRQTPLGEPLVTSRVSVSDNRIGKPGVESVKSRPPNQPSGNGNRQQVGELRALLVQFGRNAKKRQNLSIRVTRGAQLQVTLHSNQAGA